MHTSLYRKRIFLPARNQGNASAAKRSDHGFMAHWLATAQHLRVQVHLFERFEIVAKNQ